MIVYVPVGNGPLRRAIVAAGHGMIVCRIRFQFPHLECPWVFDNGAFADWKNGQPFDRRQFGRCLDKLLTLQPCRRPAWCVVPDKVADASSLGYSVGWRKDLPDELRWFLAIQDGMTAAGVETALASARFDGLFIGGSSAWKNENAVRWVAFGHERGLPVHLGRVNGWKRLQWAVTIGADSVDGTGWTRDPRWLAYLQDLPKPEALLFGGAA
ncbi:MAG TPA: hypothetical protein VEJ18_15410 [Planctomycetota bacterium]|nr:hypothetical protein [Planctomycetota bacterium]